MSPLRTWRKQGMTECILRHKSAANGDKNLDPWLPVQQPPTLTNFREVPKLEWIGYPTSTWPVFFCLFVFFVVVVVVFFGDKFTNNNHGYLWYALLSLSWVLEKGKWTFLPLRYASATRFWSLLLLVSINPYTYQWGISLGINFPPSFEVNSEKIVV